MADERVGVIGLGYVGLPLAVAFAEVGLEVIGVDMDAGKVAMLMAGRSPIRDVPEEALRAALESGRFRATTDYGALAGVEAVLICVPTPYDAMRAPDLSYVRAAAEGLVPHLRRGHLVILQSTTYPGTTEEVVRPILERGGLRAGEDFDLAFSPERIDPGNREWTVRNTPKVVGGITARSTARAAALLERLGAPVYRVSSPRVAEMSKLLENIFRSVNIALVNELALLCERMGIDIWEVIEAAKTKPFGFMAFYPGPGVGGHCIPVDPYYLSWKAREYDFYTKFIELAAEVNQGMPFHVVEKVEEALDRYERRGLRGARVLVLGVAFKREVDDARNSPAERIMELLLARGAEVAYHDPYVPRFQAGGSRFYREIVEWESVPLEEGWLRWADVVLIVTGHRAVDYPKVVATARLVVDTCNATAGIPSGSARIVRLGAPGRTPVEKEDEIPWKPEPQRSPEGRLWAARVAVIVILVGAVWFTLRYRDRFSEWARFGYPAIFLISALTNATLILPLPGLAVTTLAGGMFNPWIVGVVAGLGQAVGELSGYLAGYSGQTLAEELPRYPQIARWMRRYGPAVIFLLALVPNPLFDVAGIVAGSTRMPLLLFFIPCATGKILKNWIAAWAGFYGIELLQRWFGG